MGCSNAAGFERQTCVGVAEGAAALATVRRALLRALIALALATPVSAAAAAAGPPDPATASELLMQSRSGPVRVIVLLALDGGRALRPEATLSAAETTAQRLAIRRAQRAALARLDVVGYGSVKTFDRLPLLALEVDAAALGRLAGDPSGRAHPGGPRLAAAARAERPADRRRRGVGGSLHRRRHADRDPRHRNRRRPPVPRRQGGRRGLLLHDRPRTRARSARAASPHRPPPVPAGAAPPESSAAITAPTSPASRPAPGAEPAAWRAMGG